MVGTKSQPARPVRSTFFEVISKQRFVTVTIVYFTVEKRPLRANDGLLLAQRFETFRRFLRLASRKSLLERNQS